MRSILLWTNLSFVFCWASAQLEIEPMQQLVSFREPAQRVQQILRKLTQRTGVRLVASADLRDEIVLIDAERLPLQQILDALATALDAQWQQQPDGSHRLHRPVDQASRRLALEREQLAHRWRESLEKSAPKGLDTTLTEAEVQAALSQLRAIFSELIARPDLPLEAITDEESLVKLCETINPLQRLLYRLLSQMDWGEFTEIPLREMRVYSTRPGVFARPFPQPIAPLVSLFHQETALYERLRRDPKYGIADQLPTAIQRKPYLYGLLPELTLPSDADDLTIALVVDRTNADTLWFSLYWIALKRDGHTYVGQEGAVAFHEAPALPKIGDDKWRLCKIEWSEQSRLQLQVLNGEVSAFAPERLVALDPARVEPLSLTASDILRAYARCRQKPLVALMPDFATNPLRALRGDPLPETAPLGALEEYLKQWEWTESTVLIAKPLFATRCWGRRARRDALKTLVEQTQRRGYPDGWQDEPLAARLAPDRSSFSAVSWWLSALGVEVAYAPERAALIAAINAPLWNRLLAGETLSLSELPPPLLQQINRLCTQHLFGAITRVDTTFLQSAAVLYPNGLPRETRLRLKVMTNLGFFRENRCGVWRVFTEYSDVLQLAQQNPDEYADESLREYLREARRFLHNQVQYARQIRYSLELTPPVPKGVRIEIRLPVRCELIGAPTRWDAPPDEVKAEVEQLRQGAESGK